MFGAASTAMPQVEDGKLIAIGMAAAPARRHGAKVPTLSEQAAGFRRTALVRVMRRPAHRARSSTNLRARPTRRSSPTT